MRAVAVCILLLGTSLSAQITKDDLKDPGRSSKSDLGDHPVYTPPPPAATDAPKAVLPEDLQKVVTAQFGKGCKVATERTSLVVNYRVKAADATWTPFLTADLDNDGVQDAIIVARCEDPGARQDEYSYVMTDPYMTFHGYGDPKITQEFASGDPTQGHVVLIIHGAGAEGWRAAKPKAKFLVLNLPFHTLDITHIVARKGKPPVDALLLQEGETMSSVMWWDGKKYKWRHSLGNK